MYWRELNPTHDGKRATVFATSTPSDPVNGEGPISGTIVYPDEGSYPLLRVGKAHHYFASWFEVDIKDD